MKGNRNDMIPKNDVDFIWLIAFRFVRSSKQKTKTKLNCNSKLTELEQIRNLDSD